MNNNIFDVLKEYSIRFGISFTIMMIFFIMFIVTNHS